MCHVCRSIEEESTNRFTQEGMEQIEKAVRERNSAGDMTELELTKLELTKLESTELESIDELELSDEYT